MSDRLGLHGRSDCIGGWRAMGFCAQGVKALDLSGVCKIAAEVNVNLAAW